MLDSSKRLWFTNQGPIQFPRYIPVPLFSLKFPLLKLDNPSRPTYVIHPCRWCLHYTEIFNMASSAVVISLVFLWQLRYYHNTICHLSDGDKNAWMLTICSSHQIEKKNASLPAANISSALYPDIKGTIPHASTLLLELGNISGIICNQMGVMQQ